MMLASALVAITLASFQSVPREHLDADRMASDLGVLTVDKYTPEFVRLGSRAVPSLRRVLRGTNELQAKLAAQVLRAMGASAASATPELLKCSLNAEADTQLRVACVRAFGKMGRAAQSAIPRLIELLDDREQDFWIATQGVFTELVPVGVPELFAALDKEERPRVIQTIGEIGVPILPELMDAMESPNRLVQTGAIAAVAGMDRSSAVRTLPVLLRLVDDWRADQVVVLAALAWIGPPAARAVPSIIPLLQVGHFGGVGQRLRPTDRESALREGAILALRAIGPDAAAAVPALEALRREGWDTTSALKAIRGGHPEDRQ